jgi:hypothetical protein
MDFFTSFEPEDDGRRWWVLRGERTAVSLTAIPVPDGLALTTAILDRDGGLLMPDCFTVHQPGDKQCPALPSGCDHEGDAISGARETLRAWAAAGHDDAIIRAALKAVHEHEVSSASADTPIVHETRTEQMPGGPIRVWCSCGQWEGTAPSKKVAERDAAKHRDGAS